MLPNRYCSTKYRTSRAAEGKVGRTICEIKEIMPVAMAYAGRVDGGSVSFKTSRGLVEDVWSMYSSSHLRASTASCIGLNNAVPSHYIAQTNCLILLLYPQTAAVSLQLQSRQHNKRYVRQKANPQAQTLNLSARSARAAGL